MCKTLVSGKLRLKQQSGSYFYFIHIWKICVWGISIGGPRILNRNVASASPLVSCVKALRIDYLILKGGANCKCGILKRCWLTPARRSTNVYGITHFSWSLTLISSEDAIFISPKWFRKYSLWHLRALLTWWRYCQSCVMMVEKWTIQLFMFNINWHHMAEEDAADCLLRQTRAAIITEQWWWYLKKW